MFYFNTVKYVMFLGLCLLFPGCTQPADSSESPEHPVLLISIDGLMNEYIERNETPNFDRLLESGVQAESLIPVYPTLTFPTHYSIATGLYPENHGIIANFFYALDHGETFAYGAPDVEDERWWGGEPIWITAERQNLTSATFFWPGSEASINGVESTRWKEYDGSVPDSARVDSVAQWLDPDGEVAADLATLYFSNVDSKGHEFGPDHPEVDRATEEVDDVLGHLIEQLETINIWPDINLIIVSDHGMAELDEEKVIFLDEIIDMDDVRVLNQGAAGMLQPEEGKTGQVYSQLKEHEEHYTVYRKNEVPGHFNFSDHERIPEIIMMPDLPWMINTTENFERRGIPRGMHGFDYRDPEMQAFFLATGPGFISEGRADAFDMVQIYPLIADLLGLEPAPNDGSVQNTMHLRR